MFGDARLQRGCVRDLSYRVTDRRTANARRDAVRVDCSSHTRALTGPLDNLNQE